MSDAFYQAKRDELVAPLLARYGAPLILKRTSGETFNATTGAVTGGTVTQVTVNGVVLAKRRSEKESVQNTTLSLFVDASKLTTAPTTSDRITFGGSDYDIVDVEPVMPGGVAVAYQIRIREP